MRNIISKGILCLCMALCAATARAQDIKQGNFYMEDLHYAVGNYRMWLSVRTNPIFEYKCVDFDVEHDVCRKYGNVLVRSESSISYKLQEDDTIQIDSKGNIEQYPDGTIGCNSAFCMAGDGALEFRILLQPTPDHDPSVPLTRELYRFTAVPKGYRVEDIVFKAYTNTVIWRHEDVLNSVSAK